MRTAREIREVLRRYDRPVYIRPVCTLEVLHVLEVRERKGKLEVRTRDGWHAVLIGDQIWSPEC